MMKLLPYSSKARNIGKCALIEFDDNTSPKRRRAKIKIIINEVPLSKNKYVNIHWTKRREYKNWVRWQIFDKDKREGNKKKPFYKATITFNIFFKTKRRRDIANFLGGGLISWLDALVDLHFVKDDSYDCIGQPNITFNIDKDNPRTEIIIKKSEVESYIIIKKPTIKK